ncbi:MULTISPECIES: hypothetical protein [unclassified Streptomyces]|uniref:hypothetical protein n=1 Tax=unclassified Streptomyces TaxID=2593676 RepID=UPI0036ED8502
MEFDLFGEFESDGVAEVSCEAMKDGQIECSGEVKVRAFGPVSIPLCMAHLMGVCAWRSEGAAKDMAEAREAGALTGETPGCTYVVRMANGNVKIGMTRKKDLSRLERVAEEYNQGNPVEILAVLKGGRTTELNAFHLWNHLRVPEEVEQFRPDPELMEWIAEQGIDPSGKAVVEAYEEWCRENPGKPDPVDLFADMDW